MSTFMLDPRLEADSHFIADGPLSEFRLMDDARFNWIVLVPRVGNVIELTDLDADSQALLLREINQCCQLLRACGPCDKLNIGALGNIVRQLHVHVLARLHGDAAWPGPAWGVGSREPFAADARDHLLERLRSCLPDTGSQPP